MNLPNRLTLTRVVLTVFFVMALLLPPQGIVHAHFPYGKTLALVIFLVAGLTDWWDGVIARLRKQETDFGALLDPVADKILTTAAFICFIEQKDQNGHALVQAWMVLVIVARDFLVMGLRLVAREQGIVLRAERLGKQKTISQMITIIVTLLGLAAREDWNCLGFNPLRFDTVFSVTVFWMMLVTVALTLFSGVAYLVKNRQVFMHDA
ncbi:MAG TPA: CDP-diacylglycerol--glycerol-3-phosphate 3-phosphatidyltransferase [Verrucomicrobiae bacterium]|nr:CDP-diacylglycerol--glycerol-3-phosphate 3-phosphatidyltransferase [Verrucomicrobiae bacterium]